MIKRYKVLYPTQKNNKTDEFQQKKLLVLVNQH